MARQRPINNWCPDNTPRRSVHPVVQMLRSARRHILPFQSFLKPADRGEVQGSRYCGHERATARSHESLRRSESSRQFRTQD